MTKTKSMTHKAIYGVVIAETTASITAQLTTLLIVRMLFGSKNKCRVTKTTNKKQQQGEFFMEKQKQKTKNKLGAPPKHDGEKIMTNHLRKDQWRRVQEEAALRNISSWAMARQMIDMAITALDNKHESEQQA